MRGGFGGGPGFGLRASQDMAPRHLGLQFFEGAVIGALAGVDDPLEADESFRAGGEGIAGRAGRDFDVFRQEGIAGVLPEFGFDAAYAAEAPFVCDERVDEEALLGVGGAVLLVVLGGELGEIAGGFVEHDLVNGEDAVLRGVVAGCGLALGGWAGGILCVGAVGCALFTR